MSRPKRETRKFVGLFNIPIWDKLQAIKDETGLSYDISVIEHCILATYDARNKPYIQAIRNRALNIRETDPGKKAQRYMDEQSARKDLLKQETVDKGFEIAKGLDGKVIEHGNGFYSCEYQTYDLATPHYVSVGKLTIPFDQLDENNIINQYKTSLPNIGDIKQTVKRVLEQQLLDEDEE